MNIYSGPKAAAAPLQTAFKAKFKNGIVLAGDKSLRKWIKKGNSVKRALYANKAPTPNNKKILIDGGEEKPEVLLSYLLDRRIKTVDYIIVSHFDTDHVGRFVNGYGRTKSKTSNN